MKRSEIDWEKIVPEPFVVLLLGARGEGKTALGHRLLEVFHESDRDAYIMGFPDENAHLLPEWIETLPATITRDEWPENSIVLIHEAHMLLHARRSMDVENLELDELVSISRHKDSDIIYDTQQSQRLDKNAVAAVDGICVRWPALMQEDFERRAVKPIIKDARDALSEYVTVHDEDDFTYVEREQNDAGVDLLNKHVYVHADQFRGEYPHEVELAEHWSEDISTAYGDTEEIEAEAADDEEDEHEHPEIHKIFTDPTYRDILRKAVEWEETHDKGFQTTQIGASGGHISKLLAEEVIEYEYQSSNTKRFQLVNREATKQILEEKSD